MNQQAVMTSEVNVSPRADIRVAHAYSYPHPHSHPYPHPCSLLHPHPLGPRPQASLLLLLLLLSVYIKRIELSRCRAFAPVRDFIALYAQWAP